MNLLRIEDNSRKNKEAFSNVAKLTEKIADKTLEHLEREGAFIFPNTLKDAEDITQKQKILQTDDNDFLSGNVMGFLGLDDERLIIGSRFSDQGKDYFFQYLMHKVLFPSVLDLPFDAEQENQIFNYYLFLFPSYLKSALRKGLFKKYICNKYNDENARGFIDIARHIKVNTPFVGKIAYCQWEFSYDNNVTELIRHTIEFIKQKPYGNGLLAKVKDEVKLIIDATPGYKSYDRLKIIERNKKDIVRHAYFEEYNKLQRLCLFILQNQNAQIGNGIQKIYGILFDGAWLWEEYINLLIKDFFYHPMNKCGKDAQLLFSGNKGLIYPDFISKDYEKRIIADAKYKPSDNIGNRDYLQVLAYMFRFDAKVGYYLYPEKDNEQDLKLWLNKGTTFEDNVTRRDDISVIKHGLKIPVGAVDYHEFVEIMENNESEFVNCFKISD